MILKNKTAVITGCSKGIGLAILNKFSENSCNIIACTRSKDQEFLDQCKIIMKKNKIDIYNFFFDMENEKEVLDKSNEIANKFEKIDILVNNAGSNLTSLIQMTKVTDLHKIFQINYFSIFLFTQIILKNMMRNKSGNIINISSSAAYDAPIGRSVYSASKSALEKFSKTLSKECSAFNIRSNVIAPGLIETNMMRSSTDSKKLEDIIKKLPSKRVGKPEEIADLALFLVSDKSNYINGQILRVDGGMI